jgi:hypothetical protein
MNTIPKVSDTSSLLIDATPGSHWLVIFVFNRHSSQSHDTVMGPFSTRNLAERQGQDFTDGINTSMTAGHHFFVTFRVVTIA